MKRLLSVLMVLLLCAAMLPAGALAAGGKKTVYISATGSGSLNLRGGPGTDYPSVGFVYHGDKVTPGKTSGEWTRVTVSGSGQTGWIKTKYIDGTTKSLGSGTWKVTAASSVNLRGGPGTDYGIRGKVQPGARVKVLNTEGDWVRVTVVDSGLTGWIKAGAIGKSGSTSGGSSTGEPSTQKVRRVTSSSVELRHGANSSYTRVATLKKGTALQVLRSVEGWLKVRTRKGVTGWIESKYTKAGAPATVTASTLNVRKSPSASSGKLAMLLAGDSVNVTSVTSDGWAYIESDFVDGYVSMKYLDF